MLNNNPELSTNVNRIGAPMPTETKRLQPGMCVKLGKSHGSGEECFWVVLLAKREDHYCGLVLDNLVAVKAVRQFDLVEFDSEHILDYEADAFRNTDCVESRFGWPCTVD